MTLAELMTELGSRGLSLRRLEGDQVEVVGNASTLTDAIKTSLGEHKAEILTLLSASASPPEPAPDRPSWWSPDLSDRDSAILDEFLGLDMGAPTDWEGDDCLVDVAPCPACGSLFAWWDAWGNQHCLKCKPPLRAIKAAKKAEKLRAGK